MKMSKIGKQEPADMIYLTEHNLFFSFLFQPWFSKHNMSLKTSTIAAWLCNKKCFNTSYSANKKTALAIKSKIPSIIHNLLVKPRSCICSTSKVRI